MTCIAGIDVASTRLDIVLLDEDSHAVRWHQIPLGRNAIDSAWRMRDWLYGPSWWEHHAVRLVVVERPMGRRIRVIQAQTMVIGAVLSRLPQHIDISLPSGQQWRNLVGLHRHAPKELIAEWAKEHGADPAWNDYNAYDAFAIAYSALNHDARGTKIPTLRARAA